MLDELAVAGGLAGGPINVVRAKTVDLLVPAEAEIVIEGFIDTEMLEPEAPFGESHGYVNLQEYNAFMDVTAITRRRHPILTSFISQVTPSESSVIRRVAMEPVFLNHLRNRRCRSAASSASSMHEPLTSLYAVIAIAVRARHAGDRSLARAVWGVDAASLRRQMDRSPSTRTSIRKMPTRCSGRCPTAASRSTTCRVLDAQGSGPRAARSARRRRERLGADQRAR